MQQLVQVLVHLAVQVQEGVSGRRAIFVFYFLFLLFYITRVKFLGLNSFPEIQLFLADFYIIMDIGYT